MDNTNSYDLAVIGAGPGGYVAAIRAAQSGMRVAVIEAREVGGTCLNRGCIPTKTLVHASRLFREFLHCDKLGILAEGVSLDVERLFGRKDEVVERLRSGVQGLLKSNKIDVIYGRGTITGCGEVTACTDDGDVNIRAKNILIATGAKPFLPPIPGIDLPGVVTSDAMLDKPDALPKRLIIIGGGVIGVEFATVFDAFGCEVTIIEAADKLLPTADAEISKNLAAILKKRGVGVQTGANVLRIEKGERGLVCVFSAKGKEIVERADAVLASTGRRANIDGLFADGVSVDFERGIVVDDNFRTSMAGVYAIGDVISGGVQLAHVASAQALAAVAHMAGGESDTDMAAIPSCIYTDPEIASVGLTEQQAESRGIAVKIGRFTMMANGKSLIESQERGFVKLIFDERNETLIGAHVMCARATDIIGELASSLSRKMTAAQIAAVVRPHPTFSEGVTEAAEDAFGRAIHIAPRRTIAT